MDATSKDFHQSRTIIFNVVGLVIAIIAALQGQEWIVSNPTAAALLTAAGAAANIVLRFLTSLPISGSGSDPKAQ